MKRMTAVGLGLVGLGLAWLAYRGAMSAHPCVLEQYVYLSAQKHRTAIPTTYESWTLAQFLALPPVPGEYQAAEWALVRTSTARAIRLQGYVAEVRRKGDGDVPLHLRPEPSRQCFPQIPRGAQIVTEVTPPFQPPHPGWSDDALLALCTHQVRVRLSGWLLHDFPHGRDMGRSRASAWEIQPVTAIEVWDEAHQVGRPLP